MHFIVNYSIFVRVSPLARCNELKAPSSFPEVSYRLSQRSSTHLNHAISFPLSPRHGWRSSSPRVRSPPSPTLSPPNANLSHLKSCYSAHEHSSLTQALTLSSPDKLRSAAAAAIAGDDPSTPYPSFSAPMTSPLTSLPLDITLETLISVLLLCVALVLGAEELKPISWRVWAGKLQRGEGKKGEGEGFAALDKGRRRGFVDIRVSCGLLQVMRL